jgi:hypothetical protein
MPQRWPEAPARIAQIVVGGEFGPVKNAAELNSGPFREILLAAESEPAPAKKPPLGYCLALVLTAGEAH